MTGRAYREIVTFDEWLHRPPWMLNALCREPPDLSWHPTAGWSTVEQVAICGRCLVRAECLADALEREERYDIWGGVDSANRLRMLGVAA